MGIHFLNVPFFLLFIVFYIRASSLSPISLDDNSLGACQNSQNRLSCGAGHTCIRLGFTEYACLCKPGYAPVGTQLDKRCVEIDICKTVGNLCLNDGICQRKNDNPSEYQCKCSSGFIGVNCERKESICDTGKLCANGGQCIPRPSSTQGFQCLCARGYQGDTCDIPVTVGIGGAGVVLSRGSLVFLWGLWIFLMITFLYCGFNLISGCITRGFYKVAARPAAVANANTA